MRVTFNSTVTSMSYNGAALLDGHEYWVRVRVSMIRIGRRGRRFIFVQLTNHSSVKRTGKRKCCHRRKARIDIPAIDRFAIRQSFYILELSNNSFASVCIVTMYCRPADSLISVEIDSATANDATCWWRVRASDYYEESAWSPVWSFLLVGPNNQ